MLAGKQAPFYYPFFWIDHPSKEGGLFVSIPIQNIFDICNYLRKIYLDFSYKNVIFVSDEI